MTNDGVTNARAVGGGRDPIRVRQIPAGHAYVESLLPPEGGGDVVHLPDPPVPGAPEGQWWPHQALEPNWLSEHVDEQDLVHAHFGLEGRTTEQLRAWVGELREARLPLVHTVHDLDNPHLADQTRHHEHLQLLVEAADGLLTLTEGAADTVERRYGRRPLVARHPHVVPLDLVGVQGVRDGRPLRVGLHLKSLRTNFAPMRVLPALVEATRWAGAQLPRGVELEVRAHPEVLDPDAPRHDPVLAALLADLVGTPPAHMRVVVSERLSDGELWAYLGGLDVSVLPYAWATHSGWVEACRDLGTWVLAPDVGHLGEQGGVLSWGAPDQPAQVDRLVDLLLHAARTPMPQVRSENRVRERAEVAALHTKVYRAVLDGRRVDAETWDRLGEKETR